MKSRFDALREGQKDVLIGAAILFVVISLSLFAYALKRGSDQQKHDAAFSTCISSWASQETRVLGIRSSASADRSEALDRIIRLVARGESASSASPKERARIAKDFRHDLNVYVDASNAYKASIHKHPLPPPPKVACR